jgi:pimeloyl-ACP methyl ester carboxylesterase
MAETYDHAGKPVQHRRRRVDDIRMRYITAGSGAGLLLLHGMPQNSIYWYRVFPLITKSFTVVAPDLRGFGYTDKPPATDGCDSMTNAKDLADLMTQLGHGKLYVHGEDRDTEYAYVLAASHRERVMKLSFCEMLLSGFGLEESSFSTKDNPTALFEQRRVWCWHLTLFTLPHVPEMLVSGKERRFWEMLIKQECYNPSNIEPKALDHWIDCAKQPGGLTGIFDTYRSVFKNVEIGRDPAEKKLTLPVMTIGAPEFFGPIVRDNMLKVAENVKESEIFEECGHSLALEKPEKLPERLTSFMLKD